MKTKMIVTPDARALARDVVSDVEDEKDADRHARAVARYRAERKLVEPLGEDARPWWIDVGGEGEPCP